MVEIVYPIEKYFASYYSALSRVAAEKIYLEMIEAPPFEKVAAFQNDLIRRNGPVYYAVQDETVIGWCDIFQKESPRQNHRGSLGMGILPEYRGKGIGRRLLDKVLFHAGQVGLEKVELHVFTSNTAAIALYRRAGFIEEGLIRKYRKLDGKYFDGLMMSKFLDYRG